MYACADRASAGCAAVCQCFAGWTGRGCTISDAVIQRIRGLRSIAVRVLLSSLDQLEQSTPDETAQAVSVMTNVFADPDELPVASRAVLLALLQALLDKVLTNAAVVESARDGALVTNGTASSDGMDELIAVFGEQRDL